MAIELISFGWGFLRKDQRPPPIAERVEDVSQRFRNPMNLELLQQLDGRDPFLQEWVLNTAGVEAFLAELMVAVEAGVESVAIGCVAGRHRSVALVMLLAERLSQKSYRVTVTHLHLIRALANESLQ